MDTAVINGRYVVICRDADGNIKWEDKIENLVTTVGKDKALDTLFANAAGGAVYMGLKGAGTPDVADTQASHGTWLEITAYSGSRPTPSFNSAASGSKATSAAVVFNINGTATVAGCFINVGGSATKDDTTPTLFSVGDFSGGSKSVTSGDAISVTYTVSLT